jgi:hypothetical protein
MIAQVEEQKNNLRLSLREASSADFSRSAGEATPAFIRRGKLLRRFAPRNDIRLAG